MDNDSRDSVNGPASMTQTGGQLNEGSPDALRNKDHHGEPTWQNTLLHLGGPVARLWKKLRTRKKDGRRNVTNGATLIVVISAVLLTVGLGLILTIWSPFVANSTKRPSIDGPMPAPDSATFETPVIGPVEVNLTLEIDQKFKEEYYYPTSAGYKELEAMILTTIDSIFMNSDTSSAYEGSKVVGFRNGSVLATVLSRFRQAVVPASQNPSDLNAVLDTFVEYVQSLLESLTSQLGCCGGLQFISIIINGANIKSPFVGVSETTLPPQSVGSTTDPSTARLTDQQTDPLTTDPTHPPTAAPTDQPSHPQSVGSTHISNVQPTDSTTTLQPYTQTEEALTVAPSASPTSAPTDGPIEPPIDPTSEALTNLSTYQPTPPTSPTSALTESSTYFQTDGCVNSCLNNGTCEPVGWTGFTCECSAGFGGLRCEKELITINLGTNESTLVSSPSYPNNYPNNLDVVWIIQTVGNWRILIEFIAFNTESRYDFLQAGDGGNFSNSSTALFRVSGSNLPTRLLSVGNVMWLRFMSDQSVNMSGFSLSAQSVSSSGCVFNSCLNNGTCEPVGRFDFSCACPAGFQGIVCETETFFVSVNESSQITSPSYPSSYPNHTRLVWILQAMPNRKIVITFVAFNTERGFDFLEAGDGSDSTNFSNRFFRWSGSYKPPELLSNQNAMWLRFTSDGSVSHAGFTLLARSVPSNETLTCSDGELDCGHSVCVSDSLRCDGYYDCIDTSDEISCDCDSIFCQNNGTCMLFPSGYFRCLCSQGFAGRFCEKAFVECEAFPFIFQESDRCDGRITCPNGDDEKGCDCSGDDYLCRDSICVSRADVECNGVPDCLDYSDEGVTCNAAYCVEIQSEVCSAILTYNTTYFPNDFVKSHRQANDLITQHLPQLTVNCTDSERLALCMSFFPECPQFGSDRRVCATLCTRALECVGLDRNSNTTTLPCDVYPDRGVLSTSDGCFYNSEDVLQAGDCGRRPAASPSLNPFSRIVGGAQTHIANWPWIGSYRHASESHGCGVSLISRYWAVTAAHCSHLHHVVFGSSTLDIPFNYPHVHRVSKVFNHPRYDDQWYYHDIALLKLASPVRYTETIQPICLQIADNETEVYDRCHAMGWGRTSYEGIISPILKEARVPLLGWEQCNNNTGTRGRLFVSSSQICAGIGDEPNKTCNGDSGSPLVCQGTDGRWKMVGIANIAYRCGQTGPTAFTRVSQYINFIRYTIASDADLCGVNDFKCSSGTCITPELVCNKFPDCDDGSDEFSCDPGGMK
ncbi:uncharacterized protein LOC110975370 isoform X2 [Acanthaster planci]|uniref:Uncharacterized protein LOC110975370 isoform X2 n=1 Tax=Acanthaster planci TaxID=133434 RepID=A0A8B7XUB7_ACAPL|nr:uncharacterized protein LOC110975370 isoform X2 [Acanthaster planci]